MVYWTLDYFKLLYNEYITCGVSVREFCRERGLKENRFYYWIKMLKSQAVSALESPREFIPISSGSVSRLTQAPIEVKKENIVSVKVQDIKITVSDRPTPYCSIAYSGACPFNLESLFFEFQIETSSL